MQRNTSNQEPDNLPTIPDGAPVTEEDSSLLAGEVWAWDENDMLMVTGPQDEREDVHPFLCLNDAEA